MKLPTDIEEVAAINWTSSEVKQLTLRALHDWDRVAASRQIVQPASDEVAWEGTELDLCRTVM